MDEARFLPESAITAETEKVDKLKDLRALQRQWLKEVLADGSKLSAYRQWRELGKQNELALRFLDLCEKIATEKFGNVSSGFASSAGGQVEEFFAAMQNYAAMGKIDERGAFADRLKFLKNLQLSDGRTIDGLEILLSPEADFASKAAVFGSQIKNLLNHYYHEDLEKQRTRADEELLLPVDEPPQGLPDWEEAMGVTMFGEGEPGEEGEQAPEYEIYPGVGGYIAGARADRWNDVSRKFERSETGFPPCPNFVFDESSRRVMSFVFRGRKKQLEVPVGFAPDPKSLKVSDGGDNRMLEVIMDGYYGFALADHGPQASGQGRATVEIARVLNPLPATEVGFSQNRFELAWFGEQTKKIIQSAKDNLQNRAEALGELRKLKNQIRKILKYSNDAQAGQAYAQARQEQMFKLMEEQQKANCSAANVLLCAAFNHLGIKARVAGDYFVKSKNARGGASLTNGNRHMWVEVLHNGKIHIFDATPEGDPNFDEGSGDGEAIEEGYFGEKEARVLSDKELAELIKQIEKAVSEGAVLEKYRQEGITQKDLEVAKEAGCTPKEARDMRRDIEAALELKSPQGAKIFKQLEEVWERVKQVRLKIIRRKKGPVRLSKGSLKYPARAIMGVLSGQGDPKAGVKMQEVPSTGLELSGIDVYMLFDGSGSVENTDPNSGLPIWQEQRRFGMLYLESFAKAAQMLTDMLPELEEPTDCRLCCLVYRRQDAKVILPLGGKFSWKEKYNFWRNLSKELGGGTPDHIAHKRVTELIKEQAKPRKKQGQKPSLVQVLQLTDGDADNKVAAAFSGRGLSKMPNVEFDVLGIGSGASSVLATYGDLGKNPANYREAGSIAAKIITQDIGALARRKK